MEKDPLVKRATLSVVEAARIMGVSKNVAYEAVRQGEIPSIRLGGRILVPRAALERLLETGSGTKPASQNPNGSSPADGRSLGVVRLPPRGPQ